MLKKPTSVRAFVRHYIEMVIAMAVGMLLLVPAWSVVVDRLGWTATFDRPDLSALVMATTMSIGMATWMIYRRHSWIAIGQMSAAMYVPFLALFPPLWIGLLDGAVVHLLGHLLMLPLMAAAMLLRPQEYATHHRPA
ncbi:hypothetical protein [Plantactinospora sp. GCM10030261]|uniref:hypothetical protein n=1 Tax=Plantactinospora sp. GCM10030261 TaxID=3273420 RepID=UPI0036096816